MQDGDTVVVITKTVAGYVNLSNLLSDLRATDANVSISWKVDLNTDTTTINVYSDVLTESDVDTAISNNTITKDEYISLAQPK